MAINKDKNILDILLNKNKELIKLEVYLNKTNYQSGISAEFRIGPKNSPSNKLNIIKDIKQFLVYYENKISLKYSNVFTFDINKQRLTYSEKGIINFIYSLIDIDKIGSKYIRNKEKLVNGKLIHIPNYLLREFFYIIKDTRVYLNEDFYSRPVDSEILISNPYIEMTLKENTESYLLELSRQLPKTINDSLDVIIDGTTIYLPDKKFIDKIGPYYSLFKDETIIEISKEYEEEILRDLIPEINEVSDNLILENKIKNKVILSKPKFGFYFDKLEELISLELKVKYDNIEFNIFNDYEEKIIYRDSNKEQKIISLLRSLGFDNNKDKFYLSLGDDYSYNFFKNKIYLLQEQGEVYYSENFKGLKVINSKGIMAHISHGKFDYFKLKFNVKDISISEINNILKALKSNLKYYKLECGDFLSLEDSEFINFLKLVDVLNKDKYIYEDIIEFDKGTSLFATEYIKENNFKYVKGINLLKKFKSEYKVVNNKKYEMPENFNGKLRPYQYKGYCFLRSLEGLGFGGILGDEMGLGKTVQVIAYLSSYNNKNSLIIVPSSLLYNWQSEINKFNPTLKTLIIPNSKEITESFIKDYRLYDVIITTYTIARNNIESLRNIEFNNIFLDEAQNIKNYNSLNAKSIKQLRGINKFALTGTPIENSLMELWSIFDFIMPGYLYDKNTFNVKYNKRVMEEIQLQKILNKLISPFILRRLKKDVLEELPSKIEKVIEVELPEEQKKIYSVYTNKVIELLENKKDYDEFESDKIKILSYITKLRQLALDPSIVMNNYIGDSGKIEALIEILHQSIEEGHKILVFSQFTSVLKNIEERLKIEEIENLYLDGTTNTKKRITLVNEFNDTEVPVFLISLKAGGIGLNLQSADIVILFDPWWNPAIEAQAADRAHRIGQNNVVEVIKMIAKDTIEEKVILMQREKKMIIENILNNSSLKENTIYDLSIEEIVKLLK